MLGPTPARRARALHRADGPDADAAAVGAGQPAVAMVYMSADEVLPVAAEFRARGIPCDVLYLDIDHMDGYRVFTWDCERFPDPAGLIAKLGSQGFRVVTITDPGVKVDQAYPLYREGRERASSA